MDETCTVHIQQAGWEEPWEENADFSELYSIRFSAHRTHPQFGYMRTAAMPEVEVEPLKYTAACGMQ